MTLGGLIGAAPAPGKGWREAVRVREARDLTTPKIPSLTVPRVDV